MIEVRFFGATQGSTPGLHARTLLILLSRCCSGGGAESSTLCQTSIRHKPFARVATQLRIPLRVPQGLPSGANRMLEIALNYAGAMEEGEPYLASAKVSLAYDPIRQLPGFERVIART